MTIRIKPATPADAPIILQLIRELAEFERLLHECQATEEQLREQLFGPRPAAEVVISRISTCARSFAARVAAKSCCAISRARRWNGAAAGSNGRCSTGTSARSTSI